MRPVPVALLILLFTSMAFADDVTIENSGLTLNGNLRLAEDGELTDGAFLILHGTLGHNGMEIISALQEVLAENSQNSLAINLSLDVNDRHGFFPCDSRHTHKIEDASDELGAWLSWLQSEGADNIVLVGHSRGGNQVARFIFDHDPSVEAAILIAPSSGGESATAEREAVLKAAATTEWLRDVPFLHCPKATVNAESYLSYYGSSNRMNTPLLLNDIELPVFVFSGSDDTVVPDLARHMANVDRDNIRFEEIDGADHFFRDLYVYDIVDSTLEFLEAAGTHSD